MMPREDLAASSAPAITAPVGALTAEEMRRLEAFQRGCEYQPQCLEWEIDPQRLEFVRWLIQRGRLSEDLERG